MDAIRHADGFIDALADGRPVVPHDAADAELAALLGSWRDEMRWPPATGLITESDAIAALDAGRAQRGLGAGRERWNTSPAPTSSRRNRRGLGAIGAAAAAVLCIGGFGALVAGAGPGDALYGLRTMMFGAPKQVRDAQIGLAARTELNKVQDLIEQGDWDQAQNKLVEVSTQVASIGDQEQKQDLLDQFNDLSAKVVERDPGATAPPGVVYTVPPSAAELVPAVAPPTSVPDAPPPSATSSSATSTPATSETPTSSEPVAPTSAEQTPATSAEATDTGTDSATPTSPAPASTSAVTATPSTTGAPATAAATTTEAPAATAPPSTTEAPVATAPVTTTEQRSEGSPAATNSEAPAAATATTSPAPAAQTPAPQTAGESTQAPPQVTVTTTVLVPAPVG